MEKALDLEPGWPWPETGGWDRLYFGSETCPWLLPTNDEVVAARHESDRRGMSFTLVTPYLPEEAMERALALIEIMERMGPLEVVFNDWGLFEAIRERGCRLIPLMGRLLIRASVASPAARTAPSPSGYLGSGTLASKVFLSTLLEWGIRRVELDHVTLPSFAGVEGLAASFHHPTGLITLSGRCPWRFNGRSWTRGPCARPCREGDFRMIRHEDGFEVTVRGKAQLARRGGLPGAGEVPGLDRLVRHTGPGGGR
jgi:hypothetical protein